MIKVHYLKPFYTKINDTKLRLVFAYQYLSITKDDEIYHFIPIEGKEIVVDINTMEIYNLNDTLVFQRGNRFVRMPVYQFMLVSNVAEYLVPIVDSVKPTYNSKVNFLHTEVDQEELKELIQLLEEKNKTHYYEYLIDESLKNGDKDSFFKYSDELNNLLAEY